ncbi:hypothetical protein CEXT_261081 [Caerostris extrusa]|uniref:Gustatory receptor n=1 Tax=Caerostris extrusa TaxID=172846 RepID=A0AAV4RSB4_CAEEX|nr:hypothetical protein CEXT_261081 [Caerostris extrusa]
MLDDNERPHQAVFVEEYLESLGLERMEWNWSISRPESDRPSLVLFWYAALSPPPRYLRWAGFVEESDRDFKSRLIWFIFYLLLVFMSLERVALYYFKHSSIESNSINSLADKVAKYSPEEFVPFLQLDILKRKAKIDALLHDVQNMFSKPSLLLMMANYIFVFIA